MAAPRIGTLKPQDRTAFVSTAKRLGLDPYEFGALVHQESGFNPNVWGGAGGKYYGLIQFGGPERKEAGLDPNKIGKYTIAEQMPAVEKWLLGRGYKPGTGIDRAYATILGGNPNVNLNAKDSFGTSVAGSVPRFRRGGDLYQRAQQTLGDLQTLTSSTPAAPIQQQQQPARMAGNVTYNIFYPEALSKLRRGTGSYLEPDSTPGMDFLRMFQPRVSPMQGIVQALSAQPNYGDLYDEYANPQLT